MNKLILFCLAFLFLFNSCSNSRYLSKRTELPKIIAKAYKTQDSPYKLQPYDYLYISIKSTNKAINALYEEISSGSSKAGAGSESSFYLTGFLINDSGYVYIPTVGALKVQGLTIDQTRKLIQDKIRKILNDAIINVRLTSFNVTFLGEVKVTGRIPFYRERVNIIEGIGKAGGIGYYGDMKHVEILRQKDSTIEVYSLDLSNAHIIEQKQFYLYPNDIVYVPPKRMKDLVDFFKDYSTFMTIFTSSVTTTLLIIQLYKGK